MQILCLGLNHRTTALELREQLSLNDEAVRSALARLACGHLSSSISELVILSTCNRIELYAASSHLAFAELEAFFAEVCGVPVEHFQSCCYRLQNLKAAQHLFEVAAGLDSLVIGEPQILGQIVHALELGRGQDMVGPILNRLFQAALHAGKRARTETGISRNPASVSSLAASLAEQTVQPIAEAGVVILGAGEMAELAVEAFRKRGVKRLLVVNRTLERARALAERWQAQVATFENLDFALEFADILISSTSAPHTILSADTIRQAMESRKDRPLVVIDIAVPRDVDPGAADIPDVKLYDIDSLGAQLKDSLAGRRQEIPQVRAILAEELQEFADYLRSLDMLPIIADIRKQADAIRKELLEKTLRHLPGLTEAERDRIEAMTQAMVKKILHAPTQRLRAEASCPHGTEYAAVARSLFGLQQDDLCTLSGQSCPLSTAAD